jgi:PIN domain nuclease of toxin-antitoxin system
MSDRYLLDTHVILWAVASPERLSLEIRDLIRRRLYAVSVATLWELINKRDKPDAPVRRPGAWWDRYVVSAGTPVLSIRPEHVRHIEELPAIHKDPYDRMLIAQSVVEQMPLVTADRNIQQYQFEKKSPL